MPIQKPLNSPPAPQPDWTKRLNGYFIAFARRVFHWSPQYREAIRRAELVIGKDRRYRCGECGTMVERADKQVDHIDPVIPIGAKWSGDWNEYRDRLFVSVDKLRVLCKECHKKKTGDENKRRRQCKTKQKRKGASQQG